MSYPHGYFVEHFTFHKHGEHLTPWPRLTMATGTYPMGSAHPYPYPLGLSFTRRVTRECTRVGK
jgi:hypothetical protein